MKKYLTLFILLFSLTAYSQPQITTSKKRSQYRVNLTLTPQLYLNGINVENDNIKPNGINTRNTGGFTTGIEFERKSKSGFLLSFGIQYALQHHSLNMGYDSLGFFDKGVAQILDTLGPQIEHYSGSSSYLKFRFMTGYAFPFTILHGCQIEMRAGFTAMTGLSRFSGEYDRWIQFSRNATTYKAEIGFGDFYFGDTHTFESWWKTAECNIVLKKEVNTKHLKDISIGLELSRALFFPWEDKGMDGYFDARTLGSAQMYNPIISSDKYIQKNFSIGLRFCAGLWYK